MPNIAGTGSVAPRPALPLDESTVGAELDGLVVEADDVDGVMVALEATAISDTVGAVLVTGTVSELAIALKSSVSKSALHALTVWIQSPLAKRPQHARSVNRRAILDSSDGGFAV